MARYIKESDIYKLFEESRGIIKLHVVQIDELPRADVVEVKHGCWVRQEKMVDGKVQAEAVCSNCGTDVVYQVIDNRWQFENYCPHCGARMEGDE